MINPCFHGRGRSACSIGALTKASFLLSTLPTDVDARCALLPRQSPPPARQLHRSLACTPLRLPMIDIQALFAGILDTMWLHCSYNSPSSHGLPPGSDFAALHNQPPSLFLFSLLRWPFAPPSSSGLVRIRVAGAPVICSRTIPPPLKICLQSFWCRLPLPLIPAFCRLVV